MSQCSLNCSNSHLRNVTTDVLFYFNLTITFNDILLEDILPLLNCDFLKNALNILKNAFCKGIGGGVDQIATSNIVLGFK